MQVIVCDIQMFSNDQYVQVFDYEKNQIIYAQKIDIEDMTYAICALARRMEISQVRLSGPVSYALPYAEAIRMAYSLNYGNNNINVEVI